MTLQAEDALRRQVWESAIGAFKRGLEREPRNLRLRLGLGRAYEGRSRDKDGSPFLSLAAEQFRQAVDIDPSSVEAHEAAIAAAARSGRMEQLLADYKRRLEREPGNEAIRAALKKVQALALLSAQKPAGPPPRPRRLLEVGFLLAGVSGLLLALFFYFRPNPVSRHIAVVCLRAGLLFFAAFCIHRLWTRL